jgi:hypothetical protein
MQLSQSDFTLLNEDLRKPTDSPDKDLDYLEVYPAVELHKYVPGRATLTHYWGFHGWGDWPDAEKGGMPAGTKGGWAIEMTPLAQLKHLELRIKTDSELYDEKYKPRYSRKLLAEFRMEPTFLEFVHAILWELSFFGTPENRDAKSAELTEQVKEIDSGRAKLVPADDLFKKIKKTLDKTKKK